MEDDRGWFTLADARELYRPVGRCTVYERRPEHCRIYDCRQDDPDEWEARPHCDVARHRRMERMRARP